jgi:BASS family bile acid:Na+ symporter
MESLASVLLPGGTLPVAQALYEIGYLAIFIFVLSSMFGTGLSATLGDLVAPFRNRRLLSLALLANFILVPLLALLLITLIPMSRQLAGGLLLVSIAAGAPSTGKVAELTGGNVARAVSLTILMTIVTIILMPLVMPFALPEAQADPLSVTVDLVVLILIPILIGLLLRSRSEPIGERLLPITTRISDISILVIFLTIGIVFLSRMGDFATSPSGAVAMFVAILFILGALGLGYLIGGLAGESREEIAFGAGFRNITAVLVVIFASFTKAGNDVLLMVLMITFFSVLIVSILVGIIYRRRYGAGGAARWFRGLTGDRSPSLPPESEL